MKTTAKNLQKKCSKQLANYSSKAKKAKKLIEDIYSKRLMYWGKEDDLFNPAY